MILAGKTVIVSGVGPGLGGEVARCAVRDGANVVIGARNGPKLDAIAKELDASGERVLAHAFDITDPAGCDGLVAAAEKRFGGVDALVQVAAVDTVWGGATSTSAEDWQRVIGVNVIGTTRLCGAAVPALERRGGGSLVLISSQSALFATDTPMLAYAASKGALHSAMNQLVAELGPKKIRVNTVVPTWMWGPPVQGYCQQQAKQRGISAEAVKAELEQRFPLREIPADDDVAEVAVFLCSDRARMLSGQLIQVDGGESSV
ncbi:MAG TPA: SDR family oxidoreductase [Myxococcota bacterium]|nr:SDR family oxidoreductase [Myxococcota bacterium]